VYTNVQSRNNVFPTLTIESFEAFKGFFDFFLMVGDRRRSREDSQHYWAALNGFQDLTLPLQWICQHNGKDYVKAVHASNPIIFATVALLNQKMCIILMT
jgi:hypothetical protein